MSFEPERLFDSPNDFLALTHFCRDFQYCRKLFFAMTGTSLDRVHANSGSIFEPETVRCTGWRKRASLAAIANILG